MLGTSTLLCGGFSKVCYNSLILILMLTNAGNVSFPELQSRSPILVQFRKELDNRIPVASLKSYIYIREKIGIPLLEAAMKKTNKNFDLKSKLEVSTSRIHALLYLPGSSRALNALGVFGAISAGVFVESASWMNWCSDMRFWKETTGKE